MSTMRSKGKWLPGSKDNGKSWNNFYCEFCERGFAKSTSYERHLSTELHFKRTLVNNNPSVSSLGGGCGSYVEDPDFFEKVHHFPSQRTCRANKPLLNLPTRKSAIKCPTCFANVEKHQMGKHLISHFHCLKTNTKGRLNNTEKALILEHIHDIVIQSPFQCGNCHFYFTQRNQLLNHFSKYHSNVEIKTWAQRNVSYGWSCSACIGICAPDVDSMFKHLNSDSHMKMEVAIAKSIPIIVRKIVLQSCTVCAKQFKLSRQLISHCKQQHQLIVHQGGETSSIDQCMSTITTTADERPELISCGMELEDTDTITGESSQAASESQRVSPSDSILIPLICLTCSAVFSSENSLNRHTSHAHPRINGYQCEHCNYSNKKRSHYIRHLKTHDPTREKLFKCDRCEASFHEKYALTFHNKIHDGKPWKCNFLACSFVGRCKADIKDHSVMHQSICFHRCDHCEYSTKSKRHLNRHVKLRHIETPSVKYFSCRYCPFKAKLKDGIKRHELKHLNDQTFMCPYCDYKTRDLEFIRSHIVKRNQHPGRFLYCCRICMKSTTSAAYESNQFQDFQAHVTEEHPDHEYSNSRVGIFTIAGLRRDSNNDVDLPEIPKEEPSKAINKRFRGRQRQIGIKPSEKSISKQHYLKSSAEKVDVDDHRKHLNDKTCSVVTAKEYFVDNARNTLTSEAVDPGMAFVSTFVSSEINVDVGGTPVFYEESLPCEKETYFDLSNVLLSSVEELEAIQIEIALDSYPK